jgi:hypothetical protein
MERPAVNLVFELSESNVLVRTRRNQTSPGTVGGLKTRRTRVKSQEEKKSLALGCKKFQVSSGNDYLFWLGGSVSCVKASRH